MTTGSTTIVNNLYQTILNRNPSSSEVAGWTNLIDRGILTVDDVRSDFVNSPEAQQFVAPIVELYQAIFGRVPDQNGLQGWVGAEEGQNLTLNQLAGSFLSSSEAQAIYGTSTNINIQFVSALYKNVLGRNPDAAGLNGWLSQSGVLSRADLVADFINSQEGQSDLNPLVGKFLNAVGQGLSSAYSGSLYNYSNGTSSQVGGNFTLTTGVDLPILTGSNNTVTGTSNGVGATFTPGDQITGATDSTGNVLNLSDLGTGGTWNPTTLAGVFIANIQTAYLNSGEAVAVNTTSNSAEGFSGLTNLIVNYSDGGVGNSTVSAANTTFITAEDYATRANTDTVSGGGGVSFKADAVTTGGVTIGSTASPPTGAVTVTTTNATPGTANQTEGQITTTGGSTVSVTENITAATSTVGNAYTATSGAVAINGTTSTTSATVTQTAPVAAVAGVTAIPAATAVDTVTWAGFTGTNGTASSETIGGVTVTFAAGGATATYTAQQVAQVANGGSIAGLSRSSSGTWNVSGASDGSSNTSTFTYATANTPASLAGTGTQSGAGVAPTASIVNPGVAPVAAVTAVGGIADGAVTVNDVNASSTNQAGSIKNVSLTNYGAGATINDNALANLALTGTGAGVTINDVLSPASATTLALSLNSLTDSTGLTDTNGEITTLSIITGGTIASTLGAIADTGLTTLNVSGSQALALGTTPTSLTAVNVSGGAGLTVALGANTAFTSSSTGTDVVTISAAATKTITGNGTASEELVWNGISAPANLAALGSASGFKVLGIGSAVTGTQTFDMSQITGFSGFDVQANSTATSISLTKVTAGTPLKVDGAFTGTLGYTTADTNGATDSLAVTLGTASTQAGFTVSGLSVGDNASNGIGKLSVTSNTSTVNTITTLTDAGLSELDVSGTAGLTVAGALTSSATSMLINASDTGIAGVTLTGGISDTTLASLTASGSKAVSIGGLTTSAAALTLTNNGSSTLAVGTVTDAALTSLTLSGKVSATVSQSLTTGLTVNGGTDNSNVSITQSGATASGKTDSITLGNGTNIVSDTGALAGSAVNITAGTGQNTITLGAAATNTVTLGAHSATTVDAVTVASTGSFVPAAVISGLNASGADTINFASAASTFAFVSTSQLNGFAAATGTSNPPATLADAVSDILSSATSAGNLAQHTIAAFQFGGNTYLLDHESAGHTFTTGDTLVQLQGAYTLSNSTTVSSGILHLHG